MKEGKILNLSVLILAKNEEDNIKECIESILFADEIIVIDDYSTDATAAIAESLGAKVVKRAMNGDWGAQQTFAINQANCEWIYFIDADERMTPELAEEVKKAVILNEKYTYNIFFTLILCILYSTNYISLCRDYIRNRSSNSHS